MKILILANNDGGLYKFRKELVQALIKHKNNVWVSVPSGNYTHKLTNIGCKVINTTIQRRSTNPVKDISLMLKYRSIIKQIQPDIVLTYTIKPNIYGGLICRSQKVPYVVNITGLGSALGNKGLLQKFTVLLYKVALKKAQMVFFQNQYNLNFFAENRITKTRYKLLPGSGVNLNEYAPFPYPSEETIEFVYIGRVMKEKGIEEYLQAAQMIRQKYPDTRFHICGFCEEKYEAQLKELQDKEIIIYHGMVDDIREILKITHTTTTTTYHEGMSNILLESAACARPVIATDIPGCRETVKDGVSGYLFPAYNADAFISKIEQFIALTWEQKRDMGLAGRRKMEREFNRQIVIDAYMREIECEEKRGEQN